MCQTANHELASLYVFAGDATRRKYKGTKAFCFDVETRFDICIGKNVGAAKSLFPFLPLVLVPVYASPCIRSKNGTQRS